MLFPTLYNYISILVNNFLYFFIVVCLNSLLKTSGILLIILVLQAQIQELFSIPKYPFFYYLEKISICYFLLAKSTNEPTSTTQATEQDKWLLLFQGISM